MGQHATIWLTNTSAFVLLVMNLQIVKQVSIPWLPDPIFGIDVCQKESTNAIRISYTSEI